MNSKISIALPLTYSGLNKKKMILQEKKKMKVKRKYLRIFMARFLVLRMEYFRLMNNDAVGTDIEVGCHLLIETVQQRENTYGNPRNQWMQFFF